MTSGEVTSLLTDMSALSGLTETPHSPVVENPNLYASDDHVQFLLAVAHTPRVELRRDAILDVPHVEPVRQLGNHGGSWGVEEKRRRHSGVWGNGGVDLVSAKKRRYK